MDWGKLLNLKCLYNLDCLKYLRNLWNSMILNLIRTLVVSALLLNYPVKEAVKRCACGREANTGDGAGILVVLVGNQ
ncbi:hypothetical protein LIER_34553 [Lithospermum erythrorhizon]|uniref:Uncharacterized protein n=1 Tax=Lithospermum erythrorhizon TaxID=34254 RepID=A0AAV3S2T9_LITER